MAAYINTSNADRVREIVNDKGSRHACLRCNFDSRRKLGDFEKDMAKLLSLWVVVVYRSR